MSFSYDITQLVGQFRLQIGDRTLGSGPWPDGSNFSDEELAQLLAAEGANVGRARAAVAEVLAAAWASVFDQSAGQLKDNAGAASKKFLDLSLRLRELYGGAYQTYSLSFHRTDGYSMYGGDNPLIGANLSDYFRARLIIRRGWTS